MLSIIVAIARNGVIGHGNELPWHLPADSKYFRRITTGKTVLMGSNTYNSIVGYLGHALSNRTNVVITSDLNFVASDATTIHSREEGLALAKSCDVFIIGGRRVYKEFLLDVDRLYITWVEADVEGDVKFPEFDRKDFTEISRNFRPKDDKNQYDLTFSILQRNL